MEQSQNLAGAFFGLQPRPQEGDVVGKERFYALFGLDPPAEWGKRTDFEAGQLAFMGCMAKLQRELLELGYDLVNVRREGYRLLPYRERVQVVAKETNRDLAKALGKGVKRMRAIPHPEQLHGEDKFLRDACLIKYGHLQAILRKKN